MTNYRKVFIDTAPSIYYLERNPQYFEKARDFFSDCYKNGIEMLTSVITVEEYFVYPYRSGKVELIKNFEEFVSKIGIRILDIDKEAASQGAMVRAEFKDFKGMDALLIGAALSSGCELFLTNDKQLRQEKKIKCITLDEL